MLYQRLKTLNERRWYSIGNVIELEQNRRNLTFSQISSNGRLSRTIKFLGFIFLKFQTCEFLKTINDFLVYSGQTSGVQ